MCNPSACNVCTVDWCALYRFSDYILWLMYIPVRVHVWFHLGGHAKGEILPPNRILPSPETPNVFIVKFSQNNVQPTFNPPPPSLPVTLSK